MSEKPPEYRSTPQMYMGVLFGAPGKPEDEESEVLGKPDTTVHESEVLGLAGKPEDDDVCGVCCWSDVSHKGDYGLLQCHARPPTHGGFPMISYSDWCGEFMPRPSED